MTVYGVGLGPGDADLVTVRGRRVLESVDVVFTPGRLSRSVAREYVPESRLGDLEFPMTRDPEELRRAWRTAAAAVADAEGNETADGNESADGNETREDSHSSDGDVAFVTLGDPNVYSTFGHLRRTLDAFHPSVDVETVPGVSAVTAFSTALGVEIEAGTGLALREAADGAAPTGPERMILFKVTDAPATHDDLVDAGYDVQYGRRLYMEHGDTIVTDDPDDVADRDYYTLAYAERRDVEREPATAQFEEADSTGALEDGESGGALEEAESGGSA